MTNTTFATTNRDLENFLFNHGFTVSHTTKTYDYLTSWHFDLTDTLAACGEFMGHQVGTYTLTYYLDGSIGGQIEVEVGE